MIINGKRYIIKSKEADGTIILTQKPERALRECHIVTYQGYTGVVYRIDATRWRILLPDFKFSQIVSMPDFDFDFVKLLLADAIIAHVRVGEFPTAGTAKIQVGKFLGIVYWDDGEYCAEILNAADGNICCRCNSIAGCVAALEELL